MRALTVLTGVSGSGKSSLAFDTLFAEGQRRFLESMSTYVRMFLDEMPKPLVDKVTNCLLAIRPAYDIWCIGYDRRIIHSMVKPFDRFRSD